MFQRDAAEGDLPVPRRNLQRELVPVVGRQWGTQPDRARLPRLAPGERGAAVLEREGPTGRCRGVPCPQHCLMFSVERHGAVADPVGAEGPTAVVMRERREDGYPHLEAGWLAQHP